MKLEDLPVSVKDDALTLICGKLLGSGISRQVYENVLGPEDWVIKVEVEHSRFQNVAEWLVWEKVQHVKAIAAWFAPCNNISESGRFLVQKRTAPVTVEELRKRLPKVPVVFTDLKAGNWGKLGNKIVCHDYGYCLTTEYGMSHRLRKADWWDG